MRTPTAGRAVVGVFGLLWFLFFIGSAAWGYFWPEELRAYSSSTWTDREIRICAACYVLVGSAGAIVAVRRLVLPLFQRRAVIGRNAARCLATVGVVPSYPDFEAVHRRTMWRSLAWSIGGWVFAMTAIYVIVAVWPYLHNELCPRSALLWNTIGWLVACTAGIVFRLLRQRSAQTVWWESPHLREPCRIDFFEDGMHIYGWNFGMGLPWDQVRRLDRVDGTVALHIPRSYVIIPASAVVEPDRQSVEELLRRKV